jgi:hypothetical protein|tara:strand:- start:10119 stop:10685 length:567 start_codon:yes stop_codon:yes gene_type:complete
MGIERVDPTYVCDLSGMSAPAIDFTDGIDDDDPMEDAPEGWSQVIVRTRVANPDWTRARQAYTGALETIKEEYKDNKDPNVLIAAKFALHQQMLPFLSVAQFIVNEAGMWVHPNYIEDLMKRLDPELAAEHNENAEAIAMDDDDLDDFDDMDDMDEDDDEGVIDEVPLPQAPVAKTKTKTRSKKSATG